MLRSWRLSLFVLMCGAILVAPPLAMGNLVSAFRGYAAFVVLAAVLSPLPFPRSIRAVDAQQRSAEDGRPVIYWRPGCLFCLRLRATLGSNARQAYWVNIWTDPDGAAAVRAITGGDETVPTVVDAGRPSVNPNPGKLRDRLNTA
jgi:mycoredoxin